MSPDSRRSGRSFAPPAWVHRTLWALHRAGYRVSGGRLGLRSATVPPAWWLNLQARPEAIVDLPGGAVAVRAREPAGSERDGPWRRSVEHLADDERYAVTTGREIPVVILEFITEEAHA